MKTADVMVRGVLGILLAVVIWIAATLLGQYGAAQETIIAACIVIFLLGIAFGAVVKFIPKVVGLLALIAAIIIAVIFTIQHQHLVALCGDNYCNVGECTTCQEDCTAGQCENGICEPPLENCRNSNDCACPPETVCLSSNPHNRTINFRGCAKVVCGDSYCDAGETPTCCTDCGCKAGFFCSDNACYFQPPRISVATYLLTSNISVTSLAGNPMLTDEQGNPYPLFGLRLQSTGRANDVRVEFSISGILANIREVGTILPDETSTILWYVTPSPALLSVTEDTRSNVTLHISYADTQGDSRTITKSYPLLLLNRSTLDKYGHIALFVTNDTWTNAKTPDGIWDELRARVRVVNDTGNGLHFAQETLARGEGSPNDIAILLASAYDNAGIEPSIVVNAEGFAVRIRGTERNIILDPRKFNGPFSEGMSTEPGYAVYDLRQLRIQRNFTMLELPQ